MVEYKEIPPKTYTPMVAARIFSFRNLAISLGFAVLALIPSVFAAGGGCYDVSGQGTGVPVNGINNSGVVHFDLPLAPVLAYQGCVEDDLAPPAGDGPFYVKGWAWDDNLGWISLYCSGGMNLGVPCGGIDYGVTMDGLLGPNPGRLSGHAWSDNAGWISFNCADTGTCATSDYYVEVETTDNACLGEVYSTVLPDPSCAPNDSWSTYAWSDNVGWINFEGVKFPWVELISIAVDVDLEIVNAGDNDLAFVGPNKLEAPVADGSDAWNMILHMTQQYDGSPITPGNYTMTVNLTWADSVDTIQTDLTNGTYDNNNSGAVNKPLTFPADFGAYGATEVDAYVSDITSLAPTSSMNGYDDGGDGTVDASYEAFVLGNPNDPSDVPTNDLVLSDVQVAVVHNPTGICAFGGAGCAPQSVAGPYLGRNLHFKPAVEVDTMSDAISGDTISARYAVGNNINYSVACLGNLAGCGGVTINTIAGVNSPFVLTYDTDGTPDCQDATSFNLLTASSPLLLYPLFEYDGTECPTGTPSDFGDDAYVYTTVTYTNGSPVSYFSNKLPRVEGTLVVNPVAEIRGNVYSSGVTNPQTDQEVRSLGDVSTNVLRNTIVRNVENMVAGVGDLTGGPAQITGWGASGFIVSNINSVAPLLPDSLDIPRVYYFEDDVTITADLSWTDERTIIVNGGDLYLNGDLYNSLPIGKPKLGIIVLEDLSAVTPTGGNIYIAPSVSNIQANIYADGSVFSYSGNPADINANGEPIFADEVTRFNLLKNQLYIQGSVASQNTIGGAVKFPPILGDGTVEPSSAEGSYGATPSGRSRARLYDLNFLRYYGLVFERFDSGNAPDSSCIGDAIDQQDRLNCIATDPSYDVVAEPEATHPDGDLVPITGGVAADDLDGDQQSAIYVDFDPPSASLPGFGVSSGVDIRIRN